MFIWKNVFFSFLTFLIHFVPVDTLIANIYLYSSDDGAPVDVAVGQQPADGAPTQPNGAMGHPREVNNNKPGCSSFLDIITVPQRPKKEY